LVVVVVLVVMVLVVVVVVVVVVVLVVVVVMVVVVVVAAAAAVAVVVASTQPDTAVLNHFSTYPFQQRTNVTILRSVVTPVVLQFQETSHAHRTAYAS